MVLLQLTPESEERLRELSALDVLEDVTIAKDLRRYLSLSKAAKAIDHELLMSLASHLDQINVPGLDVDHLSYAALTQKSEAYVPHTNLKSPEYLKMMQDLEAQLAQKEYDRMVTPAKRPSSNVSSVYSAKGHTTAASVLEDAANREAWKQTRKEVSAVINVLASMAAVATAAWWALGNALPVRKVLFALAAALFIGAAEAFLYARFFYKSRSPLIPKISKPIKSSLAPNDLKRLEMRRSFSASNIRYAPASTTSPLSGEKKPLPLPPRTFSRKTVQANLLRKKAIEKARESRSRTARGGLQLTRSLSI